MAITFETAIDRYIVTAGTAKPTGVKIGSYCWDATNSIMYKPYDGTNWSVYGITVGAIQATILDDATPFHGASIALIKAKTDLIGASVALSGEATAALAAVAYTRQAGVPQVKATTIDLNQAANTYDLFTCATQPVMLSSLVIRMSGGLVAGAVTSISIQTNDATPQVLITAVQGAVANLLNQAQLFWSGNKAYLAVGQKIQLTIAGGAAGVAKVCDVVCEYEAIVSGGTL